MADNKMLPCEKKIEEFLNKYEEGRDIFKKAIDWDDAINIKPEFKNEADLPDTWIGVADRVFAILAKDKYDLDTYPNRIDLITAGQMNDLYVSTGLPSYNHWSFGKQRTREEAQYQQGKKGLAYEMVVNTNPSVAYCLENNSKMMQMLVIAHASYGHNSFFKSNNLYRKFTRPNTIVEELNSLNAYIRECEEKHGVERVELLLDACHALRMQGVDYHVRPKKRSVKERKQRRLDIIEKVEENYDSYLDWTAKDKTLTEKFNEAAKDKKPKFVGEQNILRFIAENSPVLEPWQRKIIKGVCDKNQYFYPQMMHDQVMNEGWASFWHHTLMTDVYKMDLIDDGMYQEFLTSHTNVCNIPGERSEKPVFMSMNPYKLGFEMYKDIQRICEEPTEEDKKHFPDFAGNGEWLDTIKYAMKNFRDESFILQYLSPKVMRDLLLFAVEDDSFNEEFAEVTAIHNEKGYNDIREGLSAQTRLAEVVPDISVESYDRLGDRSLNLVHKAFNYRTLDTQDTLSSLRYMSYLWGFKVTLKTLDEFDEVMDEFEIKKPSRRRKNSSPADDLYNF